MLVAAEACLATDNAVGVLRVNEVLYASTTAEFVVVDPPPNKA